MEHCTTFAHQAASTALLFITGLALVTATGLYQPAQTQTEQQGDGCQQTKGRLAGCERSDFLTGNCTAALSGFGNRWDYRASLSDPNSGFAGTHELTRTLGPDPPTEFEANDLQTLCSRRDSRIERERRFGCAAASREYRPAESAKSSRRQLKNFE
jgi:hypothetical protein